MIRSRRSLFVVSFVILCFLAVSLVPLEVRASWSGAEAAGDWSAHLVWTDGGGAVVSAGPSERCVEGPNFDRQCWSHTGGRPRLLAGAVGEGIVAAIVDAAGALWRFDGKEWTPSSLDSEVVGSLHSLAVSADGQVFASSDSEIFVWDKKRWESRELPVPLKDHRLALEASPGGRLYLGRRGDTVWTFNGRKFDRLVYGGVNLDAMTSDVDGLAYEASTNALWFVTQSGFLGRIDLDTGVGGDWRLPSLIEDSDDPSDGSAERYRIFGYEKPGGFEVLIARGVSIYSHEIDRVVWRGDASGGVVESVWPESGGRRLMVITAAGRQQQLDGSIRREGVSYRLSPVEEKKVERAEQRRPPPSILREGRLVPDLGVRFGTSVEIGDDRAESFFRFEANLGVLVAPFAPSKRGIIFWLWPRAGFKIDTNGGGSMPGLFGDVGLGVGNWLLMGAAHVGGLAAFQQGATSPGVRYSGGIYAVWGTVGIEAHLEEIAPASERIRSASILLSLNLAPIFWLASVLSER